MEATLSITVGTTADDHQIVKFKGEFDKAGHSDIKDALDSCVKAFDGKNLVFDFADLKFINSEGIGYLMEIHSHLSKLGKSLVIVGANAHIKDVFQTIGLKDVIPVHKDLVSFLNR